MRVVPISFYGCRKGYTSTPPVSSGDKTCGCLIFLLLCLPFPAPDRNSFQYLLTRQQGWCLQTQGMCNLRARLEDRWVLSHPTLPWQTDTLHTTCHPLKTLGFTLGFTAGAGNLACGAPVAALWKSIQLSLLSPKSLIPHITDLLFMHIILRTFPNNILRLGDATVSWAHLCTREGERSQQIKSVPWLLTWLV